MPAQVLSRRLAAAAVGIPLGALVTPLPPGRPDVPRADRPPVICASCGGFLNPYCKASCFLWCRTFVREVGCRTNCCCTPYHAVQSGCELVSDTLVLCLLHRFSRTAAPGAASSAAMRTRRPARC